MAEWLKATDCKSVKFSLHWFESNWPYIILMKNTNWASEVCFAFSIIFFIGCIFAYPKIIIDFFLNKSTILFYISDLNIFSYILIYSNFFVTYSLYGPVFLFMRSFWVNAFCSSEIFFTFFRLSIRVGYFHIFAIFCTNYDFADMQKFNVTEIFSNQISNFDLNYILMQYYGFYWDFILTTVLYYSVFILTTLKPNAMRFFMHSFGSGRVTEFDSSFWYVISWVWCFRFITYTLSFYFFYSGSWISDLSVFVTAVVVGEFIIFTQRFIYITQIVKLLLVIKIITIFSFEAFSYLFKAVMKNYNSLYIILRCLMFKFLN